MPTLMLDHLRGRRMRQQRAGMTQLIRLRRRHPLGEKGEHYPVRTRHYPVCVDAQFTGNMVPASPAKVEVVGRAPCRARAAISLTLHDSSEMTSTVTPRSGK